MLEDYSVFDKDTLLKMAQSNDNWDAPNALFEMHSRGYPEVPELAIRIADWAMLHDEHSTRQALFLLFAADKERAIRYISGSYERMHLYSLGGVLSDLACDFQLPKSREELDLIGKLREHLQGISSAGIALISDDYQSFMECYGSME